MRFWELLRQHFKPVQPGVDRINDQVVYREFLPDALLQKYIHCYWQLRTKRSLQENFIYNVVADGCIDIFFSRQHPQDACTMGFCKRRVEFSLEKEFDYIGIRFLPAVFPQLFNISASEFTNRCEPLQWIAPKATRYFDENFNGDETLDEIRLILDSYFLKLVSSTVFNNDPRFYNALSSIIINKGIIDVASDLDTGISHRQLRRLFNFYIGDSAKSFSNIVRFQSFLMSNPTQKSLRSHKSFFDHGYYDQAHFIKQFKVYYGMTPGKALG